MVDFTRLTRKFVANPYEVVEIIGDIPVSVDQVLAQAKLNYDVDTYFSGKTVNDYVLTPENIGTSTKVETGAHIHFMIETANTRDNPTIEIQGDTSREILTGNGVAISAKQLRRGFYSAELNENGKWQLVELNFQESEWDYIYWLIRGCIRTAELYMNIDIVQKKYRTFRNDLTGDYENVSEINELGGIVFSLRRGPVVSVDLFTYTNANNETIMLDPTKDYYVAGEKIVLKSSCRNPAMRLRCVQIQFTSGLTEITPDLLGAVLDHVCQAYTMHGLCEGDTCPTALTIPDMARATYDMYRRIHIGE